MRIAAVDVGSNSIHMVVAEVEQDGRFHVLDRAKDMVRLGAGTLRRGALSERAMANGIRTLSAFRILADRLGVTRIQAVATSAVREAANGGDFIRLVKRKVGWRVKVIQGQEEARLIYLGVRHAMDLAADSPALIVDIGGGSVEVVLVRDGEAVWMDSLKLGVARLSDRFIESDPPRGTELISLERAIDEEIGPIHDEIRQHTDQRIRKVVGTSGTMLNLIAMAGHARGKARDGKPHNLAVDASDISRLRKELSRSTRAKRLAMRGLDSKRADLIVAGAVVADRILAAVDATTVTSCTWALREGVLLDFIDRHLQGIQEVALYKSPRIRSVVRLARHLGEQSQHGSQVAKLALGLFDQLDRELGLDDSAREWLHYAALLHDVGHHIAHKNHHRHSQYLISNGDLLGFTADEIDTIAQVARYHRKSPPRDTDREFAALPAETRATVRCLSAILRVADALDRSHFGIVKNLTVERTNGRTTLVLDAGDSDAALEIWEAKQRSKPLAALLGTDVVFRLREPRGREGAEEPGNPEDPRTSSATPSARGARCGEASVAIETYEIEIKLTAARPEHMRRLADTTHIGRFELGPTRAAHLRTIYLDDSDLTLARRGVALRLRRMPEGWEMTAKWRGHSEGDLYVRPEINVTLSEELRPPYPLPPGPLEDALGDLVRGSRLVPLVVTDIDRQTRDICAAGQLVAELALDTVRHSAPDAPTARAPYYEVEVELLSGSSDVLREISPILEREFGLTRATGSKFSRALEDLYGISLADLATASSTSR